MVRELRSIPFAVGLTLAISGCAPTAGPPPQHAQTPSCPSAPPAPATPAHAADPAVVRAIEIVKAIHSEKRDAVYATFGEKFRNAISIDKYRAIAQEIDASRGKLLDATYAEEDVLEKPSATLIRVVAVFEHGAELYKVALDDKLVLVGLLVRPLNTEGKGGGSTGGTSPSAGPADDYVAKRKYVLPASGAWDVGNGGRSQSTNGHVGNTQQWYAFDLVRKGTDGKTYTGDGKKNEDYLDFGQQIRAPGDGTVVTVVDGVPDNVPGEENHYVAPGNYLVIDHGDGEYSFIAHIEHGSFAVKVGVKVKAGDVLGKVGNSGNSSEPHIHWHLADASQLEKGHGLPIRFASLRVNGKTVDAAAPVRDDRLEAAP